MRIEMATEPTTTPESSDTEMLSFSATNVTRNRTVDAVFQRSAPVFSVTKALAGRMALPMNVPWALRNDRTSAFLDDDKPIGDQVESGPGKTEKATLTLVPKTHLG